MYDEFLVRPVQNRISGPLAGGAAGPEVVGGSDAGGTPRKEKVCAWRSSHGSCFM